MKATLMQHQIKGVEFAIKNNGIAAFHMEVGTGKTISALATYSYFKQKEPQLKLLVICPISLIHGAWVKEIEKFTDYSWFDIHSNKHSESCIDRKRVDIEIVNFEYLISKAKFEELKQHLSLNTYMCVVDESSKMKNPQSKTVERMNGYWEKKQYVKGIRDLCKYRIELTGSPAPNDFHEYWAQMYFLHPGILGNNFYKFRNTYYSMSRGKEIVKGAIYDKQTLKDMFSKGYKYEFDATKREEFFNKLKDFCYVVKAKDCIDLPESVDEYRMVDMTPKQSTTYKQMKNQFVAEIKKEIAESNEGNQMIIANMVLTKMIKLRQIASGFALDENGEAHVVDSKNTKLDALMDIVEECGNEQIIIWANFKWEIQQIFENLKEIAGVSELHGGIKESERINHVNDFLNGKNRFLVAHYLSAAHGLTFVNARYAVYFSMDYSYENHTQSRGRIMRNGQKNNCVYFYILSKDTVDEEVLAVCQNKKTKQDIAERFLK